MVMTTVMMITMMTTMVLAVGTLCQVATLLLKVVVAVPLSMAVQL
jgi:hypothetical protein